MPLRRTGESTPRRGESGSRRGDPLRATGDLLRGEATGFFRGEPSLDCFEPSLSASSDLGASLLDEVAAGLGGETGFFLSGKVNFARTTFPSIWAPSTYNWAFSASALVLNSTYANPFGRFTT